MKKLISLTYHFTNSAGKRFDLEQKIGAGVFIGRPGATEKIKHLIRRKVEQVRRRRKTVEKVWIVATWEEVQEHRLVHRTILGRTFIDMIVRKT